ncbi:MAG: hypothetical protein Q8L30_01325 [bacterium]|nr:hypothetical protein [bacterium]
MSTNPFLNALAATTYITGIALAMRYGPHGSGVDSSFIAPIAFLSLFVLSAALMGYFFLYQPLRFLFEGKQKEATKFFLMTLAAFAGITAVVIATWFSLSIWLS